MGMSCLWENVERQRFTADRLIPTQMMGRTLVSLHVWAWGRGAGLAVSSGEGPARREPGVLGMRWRSEKQTCRVSGRCRRRLDFGGRSVPLPSLGLKTQVA